MRYLPRAARFLFPAILIFVNTSFITAQTDSLYRVPAGTRIKLKLSAELSSGVSSVNDTFIATISKPVTSRDITVLPVGTQFEGRVTAVNRAATGSRDGKLAFVIEKMLVGDNIKRSVEAVTVTTFRPESTQTLTFLSIAGGTAVGALIGYFAKPSGGAIVGAAAGAGIGTGTALLRKGKDVRIREKQEFEIELKSDLILPVVDF